MVTFTHFELSTILHTISAYGPRIGEGSAVKSIFGYGCDEPWTASHRREYTSADARALCDWLNQRVEYHQNLRFHAPAPLGSELDSAAAQTNIDPPDGSRSVSSASHSDSPDADDLEGGDITLSEQEQAEAALLISRETF